jgi:regulator of sigma E protease
MVSEPGQRLLGLMPSSTRVAALRAMALDPLLPLRPGDAVLAVDGRPVVSRDDLLERVETAAPGDLALTVRRDDDPLQVTLSTAHRAALISGDVAFDFDMRSASVRIQPGSALDAAGLVDGDTIVRINGIRVADYTSLQDQVREDQRSYRIEYVPQGGGETVEATVRTEDMVLFDYGLIVRPLEIFHDPGLIGSLRAGFDTSLNFLRTTWLTLTKLVTGEVATKNLGGIVSISVITYHFAESSLAQLLFFLGLLSINLGFLNILPVPVLDGGQIVFLIFEKIKGSRLSERFMNSMQIAGLVAILALVVYITYQDILRLVG